jgi:hypothetical protein
MWNLQLFTIIAAQKAKKKDRPQLTSWKRSATLPLPVPYETMGAAAYATEPGRRGCYSHPGKYFATLPTSRMVLRLRSRQRKNDRASERNGRVRAPAPVQELWRRPPSRPWAAAGELAHIGATTSTSRSRGRRRRPFAALGPRCLAVALCFSLVARLRRGRTKKLGKERRRIRREKKEERITGK